MQCGDLIYERNSGGDNEMRRWAWFVVMGMILVCGRTSAGQSLRLQDVLKAPFPENLAAAKTGNRIAWTMNEEGKRNIWVAEGADFVARQLTHYDEDDGGELSGLEFSADGKAIAFVRGEGKDSAGDYANPTSNPAGAEETVWVVSWEGGAPAKVDAGSSPRISREGKIAYERGGQIWIADMAGKDKPKQVVARGKNAPLGWSPVAENLLFVSERGDHAFIGIYDTAGQSVRFLAPSVDTDSDAVWSADGKRVAFVRQPAEKRDAPQGYFIQPDKPHPWAIWVGDAQSGNAHLIWQSGAAAQDSFPYMAAETGGGALNWANDSVVFASEQDGWQHLYSISANSGKARLLTPGNCEVEQWSLSVDARIIVFNSNCGDVDRRHLWKMGSDGSDLQALTKGEGIEWAGRPTSDGRHYAYFGSDAQNRGIVFVKEYAEGAKTTAVTSEPAGFPTGQFVVPEQTLFNSGDGMELHATVFAEEFKGWRETTGVDFFAWRTDAADAAGLALHVLLLELVRDEPVFGKPRIHCAGGKLSQRDWLWTSVPRSAGTRGAWRDGVSRRVGGWKISARARGCGRQANRIVGRELRGLSDRAGPWMELRFFRGRRGHAWSA